MTLIARFVDTEKFDTKNLVFEGNNLPDEEKMKEISSELEDATFNDYIVLSTYRRLPEHRGFSLRKNEGATWSGVYSALSALLQQKIPGLQVLNP